MAGNRNRSKLHHYVPQGYLRGFANDKHQVTMVTLGGSKQPVDVAVKRVAAQKYLYTDEEDEDPDWFENFLSKVESKALNIIEKLGEKGNFPPSADDRWTLASYVALQSVRGPDTRKTLEQLYINNIVRIVERAGGWKNLGNWLKENHGIAPTFEQKERIRQMVTQSGDPPLSLPNRTHIRHMLEVAQEIVPYIAVRPWFLVQFDRSSLITSDAPVGLVPHDSVEPGEGVGFRSAGGITVPITRKFGLLISDPLAVLEDLEAAESRIQEATAALLHGRYDKIQSGTPSMEKFFNERTAHSASERVFHHPEDWKYVPSDLPEQNLAKFNVDRLADTESDD